MATGTINNITVVAKGNYANDDVLQFAKNMPDNTLWFFCDSNNPTNHPTGCEWGAYLFFKTKGKTAILYLDRQHIASTYTISDATTQIDWHIV